MSLLSRTRAVETTVASIHADAAAVLARVGANPFTTVPAPVVVLAVTEPRRRANVATLDTFLAAEADRCNIPADTALSVLHLLAAEGWDTNTVIAANGFEARYCTQLLYAAVVDTEWAVAKAITEAGPCR